MIYAFHHVPVLTNRLSQAIDLASWKQLVWLRSPGLSLKEGVYSDIHFFSLWKPWAPLQQNFSKGVSLLPSTAVNTALLCQICSPKTKLTSTSWPYQLFCWHVLQEDKYISKNMPKKKSRRKACIDNFQRFVLNISSLHAWSYVSAQNICDIFPSFPWI